MQRSPTGKPEGAESGVRLRQLLPGGRPAVEQAGRGTVGSPRDVGPHLVGPGPAQFGLEAACGHHRRVVAIGEGFAEITGEHVAILTDNAANSADIDEAAAEEAKAKAEQRLEEGGDVSEEDAKALTQAILYSQAQIKAKRRKRG